MSLNCHDCGITLPAGAKFCFNCGAKQVLAVPPNYTTASQLKYELNLNGDVEQQISELFLDALRTRLAEEHQADRYQEYMEELYRSGFRDTVQMRGRQLAEEAVRLEKNDLNGALKVSQMLDTAYNDLLDYFIIHY
ncbi:MAG: zinc ribbon domain-containing protein [Saprospiraceae bacterium]